MLTTIQENVTVGHDGMIRLHAHGFKHNSKLSVVAVIETEKQNIDLKPEKTNNKSALGILHKYANPTLLHLEKEAFANAIGEKHTID